jgi:RNA polymerase sigma-70 factor, ECF subfamily
MTNVSMPGIDARLVERLYRQAGAQQWGLAHDAFAEALARSAAKRFGAGAVPRNDLDSYLSSLHLADLALACACAAGHDAAWDHFVLEFRPTLYRAADAIDASGGAHELADSLYAELFGVRGGSADLSRRSSSSMPRAEAERQSLFRYFHGRSSLATWLRAVLTQRHVDAIRSRARLEPLPADEELSASSPAVSEEPSVDRSRFFESIQRVLAAAIAALDPHDRLRLGCYYAQQMTLAEIGRLLQEHEATVSRNLAKTRRTIREDVERRLRHDEGLGDREVEECFASVMNDPGTLDLTSLLADGGERKKRVADRSTSEGVS